MQCSLLSGKVLDQIDRVNCNFLWGSSESSKKMYWVGWQKVTRPKTEGGLGLQTARGKNTALLAKLNWRFHSEKKALWSRVLRNKYCSSQRLNSRNNENLVCSRIWKGMKKGHEVFSKGTRWIPGRDSNLNNWFDSWSSLGPLREMVQGPLSMEEANLKIKDVITP